MLYIFANCFTNSNFSLLSTISHTFSLLPTLTLLQPSSTPLNNFRPPRDGVRYYVSLSSSILAVSLAFVIYNPRFQLKLLPMQDPRLMNSKKPKVQRSTIQQISEGYVQVYHQEGSQTMPLKNARKAPKKSMKNNVQPFYQHERPNASAKLDSAVASEYRALRRKYLLIEEESCSLENEVREAEDEIKNLQDEKFELLDELVVLEGLVNPSELHNQ